ncbi:RnfH family protein [Castellaniella sp. S9]|uniref:RnfH family protein n=1 Tax=Castellaniella sp. S9 TaxID=2993652 RepID=UPI0022B509B6|nr:RnfH family protein [Castellaniella sp. S9]
MRIELVFAAPDGLWREHLDLKAGATVAEAVAQSAFARRYPEYARPLPPLGIHGERCAPQRALGDGDRIEIYRPLVFDPLESRRRRALHKAARTT